MSPRVINFESEPLARLGEILEKNGKIDESMKVLKLSLEIEPDKSRALIAYSKCLISKKEYSEAKTILEKLLKSE